MSSKFWLWAVAIIVVSRWSPAGERLPTASDAAETAADQIAALVNQLDAPAYGERQAASQQLEDAGAAAVPHLELAVKTGSREASGRALDILRRHSEQGSEDARQAARDILTRLADSRLASTAQKARDALDPPKVPAFAEPGINAFGNGFNRVQNLQLVLGGGGRSVTLSDVNGRRSMEITDPRRQVTLQALPGGNIDVHITTLHTLPGRNIDGQTTEPKNGKIATRNTQRMTVKDIDELKRKDAEIGRLYEQYSRMTLVPRLR